MLPVASMVGRMPPLKDVALRWTYKRFAISSTVLVSTSSSNKCYRPTFKKFCAILGSVIAGLHSQKDLV